MRRALVQRRGSGASAVAAGRQKWNRHQFAMVRSCCVELSRTGTSVTYKIRYPMIVLVCMCVLVCM